MLISSKRPNLHSDSLDYPFATLCNSYALCCCTKDRRSYCCGKDYCNTKYTRYICVPHQASCEPTLVKSVYLMSFKSARFFSKFVQNNPLARQRTCAFEFKAYFVSCKTTGQTFLCLFSKQVSIYDHFLTNLEISGLPTAQLSTI